MGNTEAIHQDSLLLEQETSITETCEAEDGKSPQKGSSDVDNPVEPSDASNPAIQGNRAINEYQQEWPFIKRSPIWAVIESQELYQNLPQNPHFLPLKRIKEDYREGVAIGHMVTFANVVQRTSQLQPDDPDHIIENSLETLVELETHGFNVGTVQARLNVLLSMKAQVGELKDELKQVEKELERQNLEKSKIDEEVDQLEGKMQELHRKLVETVKKKTEKDLDHILLQANLLLVASQIMDWKVDFKKLAATPF